jgi:cardiolipin synthase
MQAVTNLLHTLGWEFTWWTALLSLAELLALMTIPSVLIQRRGQPLSALSWTLGLIAAPFLGALAWWLIGRSHLERKRRRKVRAHGQVAGGFVPLRPGTPAAGGGAEERAPATVAPPDLPAGVFPPAAARHVTICHDGGQTYETLSRMIRGAEHHVHLLFYIWQSDEVGARFRDLLVEKARAGVQVRVLLDAMGSARALGRFMRTLREAGGKVAAFSPTRFLRRSLTLNFRNHRKVAVVDGRAAYTGGMNLGVEYTRDWRDLAMFVGGPVVAHLQEVFAEDWYFATGENLAARNYVPRFEDRAEGTETETTRCTVLAGGPDTRYNATLDSFFIAITQAKERIFITTPYLAPDAATQTALRTAVLRGLDVRLLVPHRSDVPLARLAGRSYYPSLLDAGIRIFEYLPAVLHEKLWIIDSDLAVVGSANLDNRSFKLNFELSCFLHSRELNRHLADSFLKDLADSREVTQEQLRKAGYFQKLREAAMNLFSPLL